MSRPRFSLRSLVLLILLSSGSVGVWLRWTPWILVRSPAQKLQIDPNRRIAIPFGNYDSSCLVEFDSNGKEILRISLPRPLQKYDLSPDRRLIAATVDGDMLLLYDRRSGATIQEIHDCPARSCIFSDDGTSILLDYDFDSDQHIFALRRRPEPWWGIAWLQEFWIAIVSGAGLIWSVRRDRHSLKKYSKSVLSVSSLSTTA